MSVRQKSLNSVKDRMNFEKITAKSLPVLRTVSTRIWPGITYLKSLFIKYLIIFCSFHLFSINHRINTDRKDGGLGGELKIPLLADKSGQICKKYGVYVEEEGIPLRALFIIDENQILRQITCNDFDVGRNVNECLRLVQAFQFTAIHGEVCPVGWTPGADTIIPDVRASKGFFAKQ